MCVCVWCVRVAIELIVIFVRAGLYWGPKGVKKGSELNPNGVIFKHSMSECCAIFKHALRMNAV